MWIQTTRHFQRCYSGSGNPWIRTVRTEFEVAVTLTRDPMRQIWLPIGVSVAASERVLARHASMPSPTRVSPNRREPVNGSGPAVSPFDAVTDGKSNRSQSRAGSRPTGCSPSAQCGGVRARMFKGERWLEITSTGRRSPRQELTAAHAQFACALVGTNGAMFPIRFGNVGIGSRAGGDFRRHWNRQAGRVLLPTGAAADKCSPRRLRQWNGSAGRRRTTLPYSGSADVPSPTPVKIRTRTPPTALPSGA
jgi:hypothetical protein